MPAGAVEVAGAAVELTQRGVEEMIMPQRVDLTGFLQGADAGLGAVDLGDYNRPVQQINRRAMNLQQGVIQAQNRRPIGRGVAGSGAMVKGDARLQMKG